MSYYRFYEETRFKDSEIGPIPKDWQVVRLGEVAVLKQGKTPKLRDYDNKNGLRIIKVKDFNDGSKVSIIPLGERSFVKKEITKGLVKVYSGDIIILNAGHSSDVVGQKVGIVPKELDGSFYVAELTAIRAIKEKSEPYYLFGLLLTQWIREFIRSFVKGGHLYVSQLSTLPIPLPPLHEQKVIAEVLSIIQEAKEKTEAVIKATKELKKSLMKHLFTYGPVPLSETDKVKLKETEIGLIPEHWQVVRLGEVAEILMGQSPPGSSYNQSGKGLPFLQGKAEFGDIYPKAVKYTTMPIKRAKINSVLLSVRAPVGDVNIADKEYCIGRGLSSICFKESLGKNYFLFYYFIYRKKTIEELGTGSTFKAINKSQIENLPIPLPPLHEQKAVICR